MTLPAAPAHMRPLARLRLARHSRRVLFATMLLSACLSLVASLVLSIDAVRLAADPGTVLACDVNATISCGTVAQSWQASVLGFPNAFLGLMAEPVVLTIAVAGMGGVRFPRWFMASAQAVYTVGLVFAYWLFAQSMLVIGALCPWCLLVTVSTTLVFATLVRVNVRDDNLYLPRRVQAWARAAVDADLDGLAVAVWLVMLATLVVGRYGTQLLA